MDKFMQMAFLEAEKGIEAGAGGPFGAVIVKDGEVIASGHNEVLKHNDPTAHAEMIVIRQASSALQEYHLKGCTLYVTAEPCPMCSAAIHWAHIDKVVYAATKEEVAEIGFDDALISDIALHKTDDPVLFVHRPLLESKRLFKKYIDDTDRVIY